MITAYPQGLAGNRYETSVLKARLSDLWRRLTGQRSDLADFNEIVKQLNARQQIPRGRGNVSLDRIVGSVGRARDFTRTFLPRPSINRERWTRIDAAINALICLPPVELYQIGEVYFVNDGNHRVSVTRANGIQATAQSRCPASSGLSVLYRFYIVNRVPTRT